MMSSDERPAAPPADTVFPLGAHLLDDPRGGARFAVASTSADAVEVCLIDTDENGDPLSERRVELTERTFGVWHGTVPEARAGQRYGYRVHGRYEPTAGLWANPAKLLVDPYARQITGGITDLTKAVGYAEDPLSGRPSQVDSLGAVPLSVLTEPLTEPLTGPLTEPSGGAATGPRPNVPWTDTVLYELHVRGYTKLHPEVPPEHRGTYLGLAHPAVLEHLRKLGVTSVELLPVHAIADEPELIRRGQPNYWGYSTLGFFAPHAGYASVPGEELAEFRAMVAAMHAAGIEVILDVVYNHTCEVGVHGPTLCFRGLDSPEYYVHRDGRLVDLTGCGNTLDSGSLTVARLVCDSLRYWADLGVDGFRFDLATVLGRPGGGDFNPRATLLDMIVADPVLANRKLIAEPWDATGEGYRVGGFGMQWLEWNDRFRDTVRDFWRGTAGVNELAWRISGSEDLFAPSGRRPWASVNFVTAHDGFTLRDLVTYQHKHNWANGEGNRDGSDYNRSQNFGVEGESGSVTVKAKRLRTARALLATLLLSSGTPMLTAGDERWRTQRGNNNAYCQDNEISWLDWSPDSDAEALTAFTSRLTALRRSERAPGFDRFFGPKDVRWWHPEGRPLTDADWHDGNARTLGMFVGDTWLLVLHGGNDAVQYVLPNVELIPLLDSGQPDGQPLDAAPLPAGSTITVPGRTALLLGTG